LPQVEQICTLSKASFMASANGPIKLVFLLDQVQRRAPRRAGPQAGHPGKQLDQPFNFRAGDALLHSDLAPGKLA
jgi:hypothetical protein